MATDQIWPSVFFGKPDWRKNHLAWSPATTNTPHQVHPRHTTSAAMQVPLVSARHFYNSSMAPAYLKHRPRLWRSVSTASVDTDHQRDSQQGLSVTNQLSEQFQSKDKNYLSLLATLNCVTKCYHTLTYLTTGNLSVNTIPATNVAL